MAWFRTTKVPSPVTIHAFSSAHNGLANELRTEVQISQAFDPTPNKNPPQWKKYTALWDTGATGSCINAKVAQDLGLIAVGKVVCSHAQGQTITSRYLVNVGLPNNVGVREVSVTEASLDGGIDVLIGMDIITLGDFVISNHSGQTHFSFRTPSCRKICFVESIKQSKNKPSPAKKFVPTGHARNAPCHCGSGKKFKRCCGALA